MIMDISSLIVHDRLRVRVKPNARVSEITGVNDGIVQLAIAAAPEDGKANAEVERLLTKLVKRKAKVKSGFTGRDKTILFT